MRPRAQGGVMGFGFGRAAVRRQCSKHGLGVLKASLAAMLFGGAAIAATNEIPLPPPGVPSCTSPASCERAQQHPFLPPAIQTAKDAIAVAQALQAVDHAIAVAVGTRPLIPVKDVAFWHKNFTASYSNGVWVVCSKARYSQEAGGLYVGLAAQDGRLIGLGYSLNPQSPDVCLHYQKIMRAPVGPWPGPSPKR